MDPVQGEKKVDILLVEDNPADVRLTKEALKECKILVNLHVVVDGVQAMDFLRHKGEFANAANPDLVLLDLNLPKKNGIEVLQEIKNDDSLRHLPVVILTTSKAEQDIIKSYTMYASCYITKPVDLEQFIYLVKSFEDFWLTIVKLPPK
jgi:two-component system, chemotaxis family, response regulator Rcp1